MSLSLNHVVLSGNLTGDPELRTVGQDRTVAHFSIAHNRRWKDSNGQVQEDVSFIAIETWGRSAEFVGQYLSKGRAVVVSGEITEDRWEDKDGNKRSRVKIRASSVQAVDRPREANDDAGPDTGGHEAPAPAADAARRAPAGRRTETRQAPAPRTPRGPSGSADDEPPF